MIIEAREVKQSRVIDDDIDFAIIGSGAGGGVLAYYLSKAGYKVVVLEKGSYWPHEELGMREITMMTRIQSPTTFHPTKGEHTRVALLMGECYGGGTVASESVTWKLPEAVMQDWADMGMKSFSPKNRKNAEYHDELYRLLEVRPVEDRHHNQNNQLLKIACQREGIEWVSVDRPCSFCMRCGFCTQGCRYGLKNDSMTTFLKWANEHGADCYTGCEVKNIRVNYEDENDYPMRERLRAAGEKTRAELKKKIQARRSEFGGKKFTVTAEISDGKKTLPRGREPERFGLAVKARQVILAAGTTSSPRILLKSGLNTNGMVGKNFTCHPTAFTVAMFPNNIIIDCFEGINDSVECTHYTYFNRDKDYYDPKRHGFFIEAAGSLPWGVANLLPGAGDEHLSLMQNYRHTGGMEVTAMSDARGEITEDEIRYDIADSDNERLIFGSQLVAKLFLRVGAKEVYPPIPGIVVRKADDIKLIENRINGKRIGFKTKQVHLHSGHPFGGNIMGVDRTNSVVDETCEMHDIKGIHICDGSVFPTTTGVNCCMSIMFVARKAADHIMEKMKKG
jgi:choline dehydrogenase-like flavoprotein